MKYFLGVDVGTSSVRVGLINQNGELLEQKIEEIQVYNFKPDFYEQSSTEIVEKIILCIQKILDTYPVGNEILSIGFDATCSLVVLNKNFDPVCVSPSGDSKIDVIMWMDHRAIKQAEYINSTRYEGLKNVGGTISPEMDPPKILWLKQNMTFSYKNAAHFFSLPDFLVWKFTNQNVRSICCVTCKWLYKSEINRNEWDQDFWKSIDLEELAEENFAKIGSKIEKTFKYCEDLKISDYVLNKTSLNSSVKIGVSMIDAHAGGIGGICLTYGYLKNFNDLKIEDILILVSGTSSCFMASSIEPKFIKGIWGPYYEAMVPGMWLNEGGQSASGKLLDHVIHTHPCFEELKLKTKENNYTSLYDFLNNYLVEMAKKRESKNVSFMTQNIHIYPDFHGNRSPLADPNMRGQIAGLNFDTKLEDLALLYLATVQSIAYQTRHIIDEMNLHGISFRVICLIGGLMQNSLYCQLICDVCNIPVLIQNEINTSVIFGSAILGASNCEMFRTSNFKEIINYFGKSNKDIEKCNLIKPESSVQKFHQLKYQVYKEMISNQLNYRSIMNNFKTNETL